MGCVSHSPQRFSCQQKKKEKKNCGEEEIFPLQICARISCICILSCPADAATFCVVSFSSCVVCFSSLVIIILLPSDPATCETAESNSPCWTAVYPSCQCHWGSKRCCQSGNRLRIPSWCH